MEHGLFVINKVFEMLRKTLLKLAEYIPNMVLPYLVSVYYFFNRKKKYIGKGTFIDSTVQLIRYSNISIGNNSAICEGSSINVQQIKNNDFAIKIGNNCYLGHRCFISSGNSIILKDFVTIARDCKILGSSHVVTDPFSPYIMTGTTHNCSIQIGVNCFLGTNVMINGNVNIGHGSVIGANCFINNENIPPFSMVVGNPSRIIKRYSVKLKIWVDANLFSEDDERRIPKEDDYLFNLTKKYQKIPPFFHATGSKFGNLP
ncbi:acyltransferase [Amylibacter sp.]|nr:acyltransferase [Amylibacter sp.]